MYIVGFRLQYKNNFFGITDLLEEGPRARTHEIVGLFVDSVSVIIPLEKKKVLEEARDAFGRAAVGGESSQDSSLSDFGPSDEEIGLGGAHRLKRREGEVLIGLREAFDNFMFFLLSMSLDDSYYYLLKEDKEEEPILIASIKKIRNKLTDQKNIATSSNVWTSEFKEAMETYPVVAYHKKNPIFGTKRKCEACNRSNKVIFSRIVLSGCPYNPNTLVNQKSSSLPKTMMFEIGKTCHERAKTYHKLHHFQKHVYDAYQQMAKGHQYAHLDTPAKVQLISGDQMFVSREWNKFNSYLEASVQSLSLT